MSLAERQLELVSELVRCGVPLHALASTLRSLADQWEQPAIRAEIDTPTYPPSGES